MVFLFRQDSSRRQSLVSDSDPLLDQQVRASIDEDKTANLERNSSSRPIKRVTSSWASVPNKPQVIFLSLAAFTEFVYQSSARTYLFHQLRWFDPSLPDSTISTQAGIIQGCSKVVQVFSSIIVGRLADNASIGRKYMLLLGLLGYAFSSIGLAFSKTFLSAAIFQAAGGILDGNSALVRTVVAETVREKEYQSRAFMMLPLFANIGGALGPIMGGALADPVHNYPGLFKPGSLGWVSKWPYAIPSLASALLCLFTAAVVLLGLDETHEAARHRTDRGRQAGKAIARWLGSHQEDYQYKPLGDCPITDRVETVEIGVEPCPLEPPKKPRFLGLGTSTGLAIFLMPKVWLTLLSRFLFNFHAVTYNTLSRIFLPAPRASPLIHHGAYFGGGLGLTTAQVGLAMSISGLLILPLSLVVYPRISNRLGILRCYLIFLPVGLFLYTLTPFLVFVPNQTVFVWISLVAAMFLKAVSRTFTGPASTIILNSCVSDPSVRATVNGVGSSINSLASTIGPVFGGWGLGLGLKYNLVGAPWWGLAMVGLAQWLILWKLQYMD